MAVSKIIFGSSTLIDLTADTVSADKLYTGTTAHGADGAVITGTASVSVTGETLVMPAGLIQVG